MRARRYGKGLSARAVANAAPRPAPSPPLQLGRGSPLCAAGSGARGALRVAACRGSGDQQQLQRIEVVCAGCQPAAAGRAVRPGGPRRPATALPPPLPCLIPPQANGSTFPSPSDFAYKLSLDQPGQVGAGAAALGRRAAAPHGRAQRLAPRLGPMLSSRPLPHTCAPAPVSTTPLHPQPLPELQPEPVRRPGALRPVGGRGLQPAPHRAPGLQPHGAQGRALPARLQRARQVRLSHRACGGGARAGWGSAACEPLPVWPAVAECEPGTAPPACCHARRPAAWLACAPRRSCTPDGVCECEAAWAGGDCSVGVNATGCLAGSRRSAPRPDDHGVCWQECKCNDKGEECRQAAWGTGSNARAAPGSAAWRRGSPRECQCASPAACIPHLANTAPQPTWPLPPPTTPRSFADDCAGFECEAGYRRRGTAAACVQDSCTRVSR